MKYTVVCGGFNRIIELSQEHTPYFAACEAFHDAINDGSLTCALNSITSITPEGKQPVFCSTQQALSAINKWVR